MVIAVGASVLGGFFGREISAHFALRNLAVWRSLPVSRRQKMRLPVRTQLT